MIRVIRARLHEPEFVELLALSAESGTPVNTLVRRAVQLLLADRDLTYADGQSVEPV